MVHALVVGQKMMNSELPKSLQKWAKTRQMGKLRFVLQIGVLSWGIPMFIIMTFFVAPQSDAPITTNRIIGSAIIWLIGGLAFGLLTWVFSERRYRKFINEEMDSK